MSPPPGVGQASLDAMAAQIASVMPMGPYTVATLPVADATNLYRLATVTDLFGSRSTRVRCERVTIAGVDYFYWQPSSSDSFGPVSVAGANMTIGALTMPTTISLSGTIAAGIARTVTLADGAFPGQVKEVRMGGLIGALGSLNLLGTGLGAGLALLAGGYAKFASDWYSTPGQRAWVKLV